MVLDEVLRSRIDAVARRRKNADYLVAFVRFTLGMLVAFALIRALMGLLTGGQGGIPAFALALAVGVTYGLSSPRHTHTRITAARYIDHQLNLDDRLATAVERANLDNNAATRVERWLYIDAANQASFINPEELVPYSMPRETRWLVPLLILGLALSLPIYPRGLSWQLGGSRLQQVAKRADELLALADQLDRLATQQPELRQVANELRSVSEMLRNKRLPQDEALQLLRELEQEVQQSTPGTPGSNGIIDISQIQNLAQRLRRLEGSGSLFARGGQQRQGSAGNTGSGGGYGDYGEDAQSGGNAPGARGQQSGQPGNSGSNSGYAPSGSGGQSGNGSGSDPTSRGSNPSNSGTGPGNSGSGNDSGTPQNGAGSANGQSSGASPDATGQGGTQAGTARGNDTRLSSYQRQTGVNRELTTLPGQINADGKLYTGDSQGNLAPDQAEPKRAAGVSPIATTKAVEQAIVQENIPLAYQRWVKSYFAALEPGSGK